MNGPENPESELNAAEGAAQEQASERVDEHAEALEAVTDDAQSGGEEADLREQIADLQGQVLRGQAELENFRKRVRREMESDRKYAAMPLLKDLVGVIDNLRRALAAAPSAGGGDDLTMGVQMVASEIDRVLGVHGCSPVGVVGDPFDPNFHEAIAQQPSQEHGAGTVVHVHQLGYQLHDRVVRPAQVVVSSGPPAEPPTSE